MTFEAAFFGPGNRLRWDAIQAGSLSRDIQERLGPFLEDLRHEREVLFLPRVHEDWRVQWYVLCSSTRVARIARDELRAFLGPTYSDFEGQPIRLDSTDPVEAAVIAKAGDNVLKFEVPQRDLIDVARERLLLLLHLRHERPTRHTSVPRAAGRVLRDFEYALIAHDDAKAFAFITELRTAGQLSAINLLFLEVRRLAASESWSSILALPELDALLAMRRPRRVTEALIHAVYISMLRPFEDEKRATEALEYFRSEVFPRFRDLYRTSAGFSGYESDASFLMVAAVSAGSDPLFARSILAKYVSESSKRSFLASVAELIPQPVPQQMDLVAEARAAFGATEIDRAYQLALKLPHSFERSALLLRCAQDMSTLSSAQTALESVQALTKAERSRLEANVVLKRIRDELSELLMRESAPQGPTTAIPTSWADWLKRLTAPEPWRMAVAVADAAAREWNIEAFLDNATDTQDTADLLLGDRPAWGQIALRDSVPYLLEFFLSRSEDRRLKPIFENLFLVIALALPSHHKRSNPIVWGGITRESAESSYMKEV